MTPEEILKSIPRLKEPLEMTGSEYITVESAMRAMEQYGKECYNEALDEAAKEATADITGEPRYYSAKVDKDSILSLKK